MDREVALDHGVTAWGRTHGGRGGVGRVGWLPVVLVLVAVAVPVCALLGEAVRPDGAWSLDALGAVLGSSRTWRVLALTVGQAALSTVLTAAVGIPVAWVLSRYRFPGHGWVRTAAMVPFVLPSVVLGAAIASMLGPVGLIDARGSWWPVLLAHVCFNLAVFLRVVGASLDGLDPALEDAARTLGTGPLRAGVSVVVPAVAPAIGAASVVVFLFCLTSFGVIVVLGGGAVTTLEVEIWVRSTQQFDLSGAAVLAGLQVLAVVAALSLHSRFSRRSIRPDRGGRSWSRRPGGAAERVQVAAAVLVVAVVAVLPLGALLERSLRLTGGGHGWEHWRNLGTAAAGTGLAVAPLHAVVTSLISSSAATVVALLVGVPAARISSRRPGGVADRILLLPLGVSATTVGLGLLLAVGHPPVDLRRSWWLVPAAQALVAVPLVVRAVGSALSELPGAVLDVAATCGVGPRRRWWIVELPMVRGAVVAGAGLAFVASLGEFGATVFLARSDRPTVPVAIERLLSRPGPAGYGQAMALSCVLVLVCGGVLFCIDRIVDRLDRRSVGRTAGSNAGGVRLGL